MATPIVVQGTPVNPNQAFGSALSSPPPQQQQAHHHHSTAGNGNTDERAEKQETSCNDPIFVVLFYIAVFAIVGVAATYGADALSSSTTSNSSNGSTTKNYDYTGYVIVTLIIVLISLFGAGAGMALLFAIPEFLIKAALIFTVVMAGVWAVFAFYSGSIAAGVIGVIFFALSLCYARMVWSRIPFATANLVTATTAIKANLGVAVYAYFFAILAGGWCVCWALAFVGVFDTTYSCNETTNVCSSPSYGILFVLFLAFFFVHQVIQVRRSSHVGVLLLFYIALSTTVSIPCFSYQLCLFLFYCLLSELDSRHSGGCRGNLVYVL
jgi:Plasma-membrane choline transporter